MVDEGALDLHCRDNVPSHEHDVVDASEQPEKSLIVDFGSVSGEIVAGEFRPIDVLEALRIAVNSPRHARPWMRQNEEATDFRALRGRDVLPALVEDRGPDTRKGLSGRTWLRLRNPREGRDHD